MTLAVAKADGFDEFEAIERPGEAGGRILSARKQDECRNVVDRHQLKPSVHHEHGDICMRNDMTRDAADQAFAQTAAAITADHQQVRIVLFCGLQKRLTNTPVAGIDQAFRGGYAVERKIFLETDSRFGRQRWPLDAEYLDMGGVFEK